MRDKISPGFARSRMRCLLAAISVGCASLAAAEELNPIVPVAEAVSVGLAGNQPADIARYLLARGAEEAAISPDGNMAALIRTVTGVRQLWVLSLDGRGEYPRQLTFGNGVDFFEWAPDSASILYGADNDGNERPAYYLISTDGTSERLLMPATEKGFRHFGAFSPGGDRIAFASTERNGEDFDIYVADVADVATGEATMIYQGASSFFVAGWIPGSERLVIADSVGEDSNNLYLIDIPTGELITLYAPEQPANHTSGFRFPHSGSPAAFTPDGKQMYFSTNKGGEFLAMGSRSIAPEAQFELLDEAAHDLEDPVLCGEHYLAYTINAAGADRLKVLDLRDNSEAPVPSLQDGILDISCSKGRARMLIRVSAFDTPGDLRVWDIGQPDSIRVFQSTLAGLDGSDFVEPISINMPARDGVELQAILYLPADAVEKKPPLLFEVHGGPTAESRKGFNPVAQFYAAQGVAVVAPNIRGSTGRGRTYLSLDNREKRLDSVRDVVDILNHLKSDHRVDASRAAVKGGSYGGYVVNAVLAAYPESFIGGVSLFGVGDWVTALQVASPTLKASDRIEYGDIGEQRWIDFYTENSPITNADRIRVPVLYSHGANDPRIDKAETEMMVRALRSNGINAPYILMPDEGHGWSKPSNNLFYFRRESEFLEELFAGIAE